MWTSLRLFLVMVIRLLSFCVTGLFLYLLLSNSLSNPTPAYASHRSTVLPPSELHQTLIISDTYPLYLPMGIYDRPSEGQIVFTSGRDGNSEIYVINADGTDEERLTVSGYLDKAPGWSPDNTKIAFHSDRPLGPNGSYRSIIYVMNADGSDEQRLTDLENDSTHPDWSPDGGRIIYSSDAGGEWGHYDIFVMNADGTNPTQLTFTEDVNEYGPAWSPDGERIAFFSYEGLGQNGIYLMEQDGSNVLRLIDGLEPAWSPDGSRIVYWLDDDIYVISVDGTDKRRLITDPGAPMHPTWSPDGSRIAFDSGRPPGNRELFTVKSDGSNLHRITFLPCCDPPYPHINHSPDWSN